MHESKVALTRGGAAIRLMSALNLVERSVHYSRRAAASCIPRSDMKARMIFINRLWLGLILAVAIGRASRCRGTGFLHIDSIA